MGLHNESKINYLLQHWQTGTPAQTAWLRELGYSDQLINKYKKSNWLVPFGTGAYKRPNDEISYIGALHALQQQTKMTVHPAGATALRMLGKSHYLELSQKQVFLMGKPQEKLPAWFLKHQWDIDFNYTTTSFLPSGLGMVLQEETNFSLQVSGAARAMMECLYLAPKHQDLIACYELMEGLSNLRPKVVQELLEACTSVKVKRLFLYMAEKAGHSWFRFLKLHDINLGSGKRSIVSAGVYLQKYQITVPEKLEEYGRI